MKEQKLEKNERKQTDLESQNSNYESKKEDIKIGETKNQLNEMEREKEKERKFEEGMKKLKLNLIMDSLIYISSIFEKSFIASQASEDEVF